MKSLDIANQLKILLPEYSTKFNDTFAVSSINVVGDTTQITSNDHGLVDGQAITISGYLFRNAITAVEEHTYGSRPGFLITTTVNHDLTKRVNETKTVTLAGFTDEDWNGEFELLQAGRNNFVIATSNDAPVLNGNEVLLEDRLDYPVNGQHDITVIDTDTFSINQVINGSLESYWKFSSSVRVAIAYSVDNAVKLYTEYQTNDYWAFIIMNNPIVSKDRSTLSDATADGPTSASLDLTVIDGFQILVFIPSYSSLSIGAVIDEARHDLQIAINRCLLGSVFDSGFDNSQQYKSIFTGSSSILYDESNGAYFVYGYDFEVVYNLSDIDGVTPAKSRAFRDLDYTSNEYTNTDNIPLQDNIS